MLTLVKPFGQTAVETEIKAGSYSYLLRRFEYHGRNWLSISRWKKWNQDGEYHPSTGMMIPEELFQADILPALCKLYGTEVA